MLTEDYVLFEIFVQAYRTPNRRINKQDILEIATVRSFFYEAPHGCSLQATLHI